MRRNVCIGAAVSDAAAAVVLQALATGSARPCVCILDDTYLQLKHGWLPSHYVQTPLLESEHISSNCSHVHGTHDLRPDQDQEHRPIQIDVCGWLSYTLLSAVTRGTRYRMSSSLLLFRRRGHSFGLLDRLEFIAIIINVSSFPLASV